MTAAAFFRRHRRVLGPIVACYAVTATLGVVTVHHFINVRTKVILDAAQRDVTETYMEAIDAALALTANSAARTIGTAHPDTCERARYGAWLRGVDELNVADSNGVWIASSEEGVVGTRFADSLRTAGYAALLTNGAPYASQPFRPSVVDPGKVRKYLAVPFPDRSGILQVGYDASRVASDFATSFHEFLEEWNGGDSRFYLAIGRDGRLLASGLPTTARTAAAAGLPATFPADEGKTFSATVLGVPCWCRAQRVANVRLVTALPKSEFNDRKFYWVLTSNLMLFALFAVLAVFYLVNERQRSALEALKRSEEARRREDLAMAKAIQGSALPAVFPPYPRDLTVDLFARMDPARDVGGDFYDFHYVGRDRLAVLVADVSGKGVPAAMFMMKAKAVLHDLTMSVTDLGEVVTKANAALCEGNAADMFVTCWLGVLDETTGVLRYVNAGHNPPYVCRATDGSLKPLEEVSGMFLGGMPGLRYRAFETRLEPGDLLFAFTDGVTEANNTFGQMFGEARLEEVLRGERGLGLARFAKRRAARPSAETVCARVKGAVDGFAGRAAQFDDITMLALRYRGAPETARKTVPAALASVPALSAFAEERLDAAGCSAEKKADLLVALDEIANNVASYSGAKEMTLEVEVAHDPFVIRLRVLDDGKPWNPLDHLDPDISLSADDRAIGGLGILMVKKLMDDVSYIRRAGRNVLAFRLKVRDE